MFNSYSAGLGSLVPIKQLYSSLFTSSRARQEPASRLYIEEISRKFSNSNFLSSYRLVHYLAQHNYSQFAARS